jgi:hypothetical protein
MDDKKISGRRIVSEEVYDQINSRPPWIVGKGLSTIFLLIIIATACAAMIRYPETTPVMIRIVPSQKPIRFLMPDTIPVTTLTPPGHEVAAGEEIAVTAAPGAGPGGNPVRTPVAGRLYVGYDYDKMCTILQIIPDSTKYAFWGEFSDSYAGKVVIGTIVRIRLRPGGRSASYLRGRVSAISSFPVEHKYAVRISLDIASGDLDKLISVDGGNLDCSGDLEISNTSILRRVFIQFFHLKRIN